MSGEQRRRVALQRSETRGTSYHLDAELRDGAVVIRGDDYGSAVEEFFGGGQRGYEWAITVAEGDVPELLAVIGEDEDADPLEALRRWVEGGGTTHFRALLDEHDVEYDFWSWISD